MREIVYAESKESRGKLGTGKYYVYNNNTYMCDKYVSSYSYDQLHDNIFKMLMFVVRLLRQIRSKRINNRLIHHKRNQWPP